MAAEIYETDSMFSVREKPWHGLGIILQENPRCAADAIQAAGLGWEVIPTPIFANGQEIAGYKANVRSDNKECLGIVSDRYQVIQNEESFDFLDYIMDYEDIRYETAGSLKRGKIIWALVHLPKYKILGDEIENYLLVSNGHDGTAAIRVNSTNIRVVCNNTLNVALQNAARSWSTTHTGDIKAKIESAKKALALNDRYKKQLDITAQALALQSISANKVMDIVSRLYPINEDKEGKTFNKLMERNRNDLLARLQAPDLENFKGTKWAVVNALSDHIFHREPLRKTETYKEGRMKSVIMNNPKFDVAYEMLLAA